MLITDEIKQMIFDKCPNIKINADAIYHIRWNGATGLMRFMSYSVDCWKLQQERSFGIVYSYPVSYGSYNGHRTDEVTLWN